MKCNLNTLYKVHVFVSCILLIINILGCIQATFMFGSEVSIKYVWFPSIPFMLSSFIILVLAIYRRHIAFIIGLIQVLLSLQTFETFLQLPNWEVSFDLYSFVTTTFMTELTAIFNLLFLITSLFGTYLFVKKVFSQKRSG